MIAVGSAEGPLAIAEQLGFQQGWGNRRTVHDLQRAIATRTVAMQCLGHKFLARAAFAIDENREWLLRRLADLLTQVHDRVAVADQLISNGRDDPQSAVLGHEFPLGAEGFEHRREIARNRTEKVDVPLGEAAAER